MPGLAALSLALSVPPARPPVRFPVRHHAAFVVFEVDGFELRLLFIERHPTEMLASYQLLLGDAIMR